MSFVSVLLAPFALLFGSDAPADKPAPPPPEPVGLSVPAANSPLGFDPADEPGWQTIAETFRAPDAEQVRIEQRIIIRISPQRPMPRRNLMMDLPNRAVGGKFNEKRMGDCIGVANIAGVQPDGDDRLLLYLRDRRTVSARLERSCRARDFYSGFYLQNSTDGRLCVDRDTLQSRSGANCKISRIRQLVEDGD